MVCCPNHSFRIENQTSHLPTPSPHFRVGLLYSTASRRAFEMGKEQGDIARGEKRELVHRHGFKSWFCLQWVL